MQLAKSITYKRINTLHCFFLTTLVLLFTAFTPVLAQDNSPYSRFGIGDLNNPLNIINRSMGGISAGYNDNLSINFSNPASYSSFQSLVEAKSKKIVSGRAILDFGVNIEGRTLREPATAKKFTANNALFSYVQVGVPLKKNWGLNFGIRPVSRISYKMVRFDRLKDPNTNLPIDSSATRFEGSGGSYYTSVGTGLALFQRVRASKSNLEEKLSVGINAGYLFGGKDYSSVLHIINDSISYYDARYQTKTNFGNFNFNAGIQYKVPVNNKMIFNLGMYGSWGQKLNANQDIVRETIFYNANSGESRLDSVSEQRNIKGKIVLPATLTVGFVFQKLPVANKESGWLFGIDFEHQGWSKYRYYGQTDFVTNKWELRAGGQFNPVPKRNYFSNVAYRFGFFTGPDYIKVGKSLSQIGGSLGLGLPLGYSRQAPNQITIINMGLEFSKRGNNSNLLKENLFKLSLGFSLSDMWFGKRKYD
jgi:hypothetical protein